MGRPEVETATQSDDSIIFLGIGSYCRVDREQTLQDMKANKPKISRLTTLFISRS